MFKNYTKLILCIFTFSLITGITACSDDPAAGSSSSSVVTIINNKIYVDGTNFRVKSIGFEPFMPGESPGDQDYPTKINYTYALQKIKELNCNTVYLLTGDPANLQTAFFEQAKAEGIFIILGLWFSGDAEYWPGGNSTIVNFQDVGFKTHVKTLITNFIIKFHNIGGVDYSSQILYVTLGNEFTTDALTRTVTDHPTLTSYNGTYVSAASGSHPAECFLAEMADYFKKFEMQNYGHTHYITHHTWPTVSPGIVKFSFLDIISYNVYSYDPPSVSGHAGGSVTGTPYQGALEEYVSFYPNKPFVVSEFGRSVAPDGTASPVTNQVGQAVELLNRWTDITSTTNIAGGSIHQLFDQWHKNGYQFPNEFNSKDSHNTVDYEEWFGIIGITNSDVTDYDLLPKYDLRPAFYTTQNMYAQ
ncbi:MAG: hypothetical protein KAR07_05985 [Spirochaetes bacterium]|nr:hypothetical protein [Spirochaetota bacterium]